MASTLHVTAVRGGGARVRHHKKQTWKQTHSIRLVSMQSEKRAEMGVLQWQ
jgi:hypothetical protein